MQKAINIAQKIVLPELQQDSSFDPVKASVPFWESFTKALLDFEKDAKPIYTSIYSLELNNAEAVISILPNIYKTFISELAERYVLGETSLETEHLIATKNPTFQEQITFFKTLENVVKKVERKRLKSELPKLYDKLTFEIPEATVEAAVKQKGREALKQKMKLWDEGHVAAEAKTVFDNRNHAEMDYSIDASLKKEGETKIISLSHIKYAVAACFVIGLSIWFFNNHTQESKIDSVVTTPENEVLYEKFSATGYSSETIAEATIVSKSVSVLENTGLGFASVGDKVTIIENLQGDRITSITKAIENYQERLEKEVSLQHDQTNLELLNTRIETLQSELNKLKEREKHYRFNTKELNVYVSSTNNTYEVIQLDSLFYLIKNKQLYRLTPSENPIPYSNVQDSLIINQIDDILFKNGLPTIND